MVSSYPSFDIKRFKKKNFEVSPPSCIQTHCVDKTILVHQSWLDLTSGTFNHISHFVSFEETPFVSWFIYFSPLTPHPAPPPPLSMDLYPHFLLRKPKKKHPNPTKNTKSLTKPSPFSPRDVSFRHLPGAKGIQASGPQGSSIVENGRKSCRAPWKKNCCEFCFPSFF